ncbi:MAG: NAD(P)-dependent oxidoreductase [Anaerolineae bacterium]|nr:NAD(P)-dependent oxidoreductase [Anaerolineae bacterium]
METNVVLVTGGLGCIGAWTLYHLAQRGVKAICFDLGSSRHRLNLLMSADEQEAITFVPGDLTDFEQVKAALQDHGVTHIVHLAALQVPFCRANPVMGAQVNVVGTVNIFEAAKQTGIKHLAQASSIAIYGTPEEYTDITGDDGLIPNKALPNPHTLYGVYKVAGEGIASVYWGENGISSTALRPYTVYGLGRDQGMTSEPTKAMQAAAAGQPFHISFGGTMQFQWASDAAQQFIEAAFCPTEGAHAYNLGGVPITVEAAAAIIRGIRPDAQITVDPKPLAFPRGFDDAALRAAMPVYETPLEEGIRATLEGFERARM